MKKYGLTERISLPFSTLSLAFEHVPAVSKESPAMSNVMLASVAASQDAAMMKFVPVENTLSGIVPVRRTVAEPVAESAQTAAESPREVTLPMSSVAPGSSVTALPTAISPGSARTVSFPTVTADEPNGTAVRFVTEKLPPPINDTGPSPSNLAPSVTANLFALLMQSPAPSQW